MPRIIAISILNSLGVHMFDGWRTVAFAVAPGEDSKRTAGYSFRLMQNFGLPQNWEQTIRAIAKPTAVLVGSRDQLFIADQYKPTFTGLQPAIRVEILEGPDHMGITLDPVALDALLRNAQMLLSTGGE